MLGGVYLQNGIVFESKRLAVDDGEKEPVLDAPDRVGHSIPFLVRLKDVRLLYVA